MIDRKLLQEALDALEFPHDSEWSNKAKAIEALQNALTQPEQEPVAWIGEGGKLLSYKNVPMPKNIPVYAAPPRKEWVGLTLNDITGHMCDCGDDNGTYQTSCFIDYAKSIEQKLKDLNTTNQ